MSLTDSQSARLYSFSRARTRLHEAYGSLRRANFNAAAHPDSARIRDIQAHWLGVSRSRLPVSDLAGKNAAAALPMARSEIESLMENDASDFDELSSGEAAVVIGAEAQVEDIEDKYDLIPMTWWFDPKNRMMVEAGYDPFEIDPDLRMRAMMAQGAAAPTSMWGSAGYAPGVVQGFTPSAETLANVEAAREYATPGDRRSTAAGKRKRHKVTIKADGAKKIKVWQINNGGTRLLKTIVNKKSGFVKTVKQMGGAGRRADNPAKLKIKVWWKNSAGGGTTTYKKNFSNAGTWSIATPSAGGGSEASSNDSPRAESRDRRSGQVRVAAARRKALRRFILRKRALRLKYRRLRRGPRGRYLNPAKARNLRRTLRVLTRKIARLRSELGIGKAVGVIQEVNAKPKTDRAFDIATAIAMTGVLTSAIPSDPVAESKVAIVIQQVMENRFAAKFPKGLMGPHRDIPGLANYIAKRIYPGRPRYSRGGAHKMLIRMFRGSLSSEVPVGKRIPLARAIVQALAQHAWLIPPAVEVKAEQAAEIKDAVLESAGTLVTAVSELEQAQAQLDENKEEVEVAVETAASTEGADKAAAESEASEAAAEIDRLEELVQQLAAQVSALTESTASQFANAQGELMGLATEMGTLLGGQEGAIEEIYSALTHEGEIASGAEADFASVAAADPTLPTEQPIEGMSISGYGAMDYGYYGLSPAAQQALNQGGPDARNQGPQANNGGRRGGFSDAQAGMVGSIVGAAGGIIGGILNLFGPQPQQPQAAPQQPGVVYMPPAGGGGYDESPATNWTPWLIGGGLVAAAGIAAVVIAGSGAGGEGNMLMSRDRDGEFVPRSVAAPGFLEYGSRRIDHMPSRDLSGRFVGSSSRAPSLGGRASGWAYLDDDGEIEGMEYDGYDSGIW
jgi:hypothetical protein